jgi:NAD(P)-dependent dehydrogenase (short-subunit alcohol dehydrogenase family)
MLGKALAVEEAAHGIRVLTVCPGVVETPIHLQRPGVAESGVEAFARQMDALHPLGRSGTPADVASLVLFLASDAASWMTGSVVTVDGGIVLV